MATPQPDRAFWDRVLPADLPAWIQRDPATGAPFTINPGDGRKIYLSPAAFGGSSPADTTSIFRKSPRWNAETGRWETPFDWGNVAGLTAGGLIGGGVAATLAGGGGAAGGTAGAGAGGSGAGATGAVLPSTQIGTGYLPAIAGGAGTNVAELLGATGASAAGGATGAAGSGAGAAAGAAGAGSSVADIVRRLAQVGIPIGTLLGTRALTNRGEGGSSGQDSAISPELQQLLAMAMRRMSAQEPLFQAVNRQALAGLPDYAKRGG